MKSSDRNLLLGAGAVGLVAWLAYAKKNTGSTVSGIPGIGAVLPNSTLLPEKWRGACSPAWADAALWGSVGAGACYLLAPGKKGKRGRR